MSSIKKHLEKMLDETTRLNLDGHVTEPDEFVAVNEIERAIHNARIVFERMKK